MEAIPKRWRADQNRFHHPRMHFLPSLRAAIDEINHITRSLLLFKLRNPSSSSDKRPPGPLHSTKFIRHGMPGLATSSAPHDAHTTNSKIFANRSLVIRLHEIVRTLHQDHCRGHRNGLEFWSLGRPWIHYMLGSTSCSSTLSNFFPASRRKWSSGLCGTKSRLDLRCFPYRDRSNTSDPGFQATVATSACNTWSGHALQDRPRQPRKQRFITGILSWGVLSNALRVLSGLPTNQSCSQELHLCRCCR